MVFIINFYFCFLVAALITNSVKTVSTTPSGNSMYAFGTNAATRYKTKEIAATVIAYGS